MLCVEDVVEATVCRIENYGVYLKYEDLEIYVKPVDLTWKEGVLDIFAFTKIGEIHKVKIIRCINSNSYLGSIKDVNPEDNPWNDASLYPIGKTFYGRIEKITEYGCFVELKTGALGLILIENCHTSLIEGHLVKVSIKSADIKKKRVSLILAG